MKTVDEPIVVEQTFKAPISAVWKALTEVDQMRLWFFDCIPDFKAEVGFETKFTITNNDRVFPHQWKVTEVVPEKKLAYNWNYKGYSGDSFVVFELSEKNNHTTLKLTHQVTETFSNNISEFKRESGLAGWKYFIQKSLKQYLEKDWKWKLKVHSTTTKN